VTEIRLLDSPQAALVPARFRLPSWIWRRPQNCVRLLTWTVAAI